MRTQIYKQYSGEWASKPFPGGGTTVKGAGCGLCSVTHVIIEDDRYKDYTPEDVRGYMIKWAVRDAGLIHEGIPDSLRHYGMENVKEFGRNATMNDIFTELNKGSRKGVILFYKCNSRGKTIPSVGPDGTCWTGGGHFIGFTDYKVENGKHYFYMKDSGGRDHDGFFSYEDSMRGCVWKVWTCTVPKKSAAKTDSTKTAAEKKVIDVSYVQNSIDWNQVKASGIEGAMIRCGYRGYVSGTLMEDDCFKKHVQGAVKAGLKVGVYFFTEAVNAAEGKEEAVFALNLIKREGIKLSYPVAVDTEAINAQNVRANNISVAKRTEAIKAFCDTVKAQGYEPMIYASTSWLENKLNMSKLPYKVWVAQYNDKVTYKGSYVMWQYTSTGKVSGISGVVDLNKSYLNGKTIEPKKTVKNEILAVDGVVGTDTIKAAQMIFNTPIDGIISGQAKTDMKYCPAISKDCLKEGKGGSQLVRALQRKVGAKEDGYLGTNTIKKIQKWLNIPVDGYWGSHTSRSFQIWVNKQVEAKERKETPKPTPAPTPKPNPKPTPVKLQVPTAAEIKEASVWAVRHDICEWHRQIAASGKYYYKRFSDDPDTQKCPICNPGTGNGWNCIGESWAGLRHGGKVPCRCNCEVINDTCGNRLVSMTYADALATVKRKAGINDLDVIVDRNGISTAKLLPGDIVLYFDGNEYKHSATWMGNNRIADCSSANPGPHGGVVADKKHITYWDIKIVIRYTGGRTYLSIGARGEAVKKIQAIIGTTVDDHFGTGTRDALKAWQKKHGLEADGFCGPATLKKMAEVIK